MINILFTKYIKISKQYNENLNNHNYIKAQEFYNIMKYIEHRLFDYYDIESFSISEKFYEKNGEYKSFKTIKKYL